MGYTVFLRGLSVADIFPPLRDEQVFGENGRFTLRYSEYLEDTAENINEATSILDDSTTVNPGAAQFAFMLKKINDIEDQLSISSASMMSGVLSKYKVVQTTTNYTTLGNEIVWCLNASGTDIDITLNTGAKDGENVIVIRQGNALGDAGHVDVIGSVFGGVSLQIGGQYDAPNLTYLSSISSWGAF